MGKGKELILRLTKKDFRFDYFRAGGKGGQKQNKTETGVRVTHLASGVAHESRVHASQLQNRKAAFDAVTQDPRFKLWLTLESAKASLSSQEKYQREREVEREVEEQMRPENIEVQVKDDKGRWIVSE
jgi:protein subunit release factor B